MKSSVSLAAACLFALCFCQTGFGQAGVSSMSSTALRSGITLKSGEIRVEELINFHRHQIPLPGWEHRIGLDTRANKMPDGKTAFQIGLATHRDVVEEHRVPLNLVLVIDRSGSMNGDRIRKVKNSLGKLIGKLTDRDLVSVVTYSTEASICLETTTGGDADAVASAISSIEAGGSTNLNAGLMKGYEVALRNLDDDRANRVILLTDGIANVGVTAEKQIASASKEYNEKGIGLSTIGLGASFNRSLLRELADAGRGAIHFIADANDIQKVFVDEFDSLLSPAAMDVSLTIRVPDGNPMPKIFGYEPQKSRNEYRIPMENMSYGATQVVVGKFGARVPPQIEVELNYYDSVTKKKVTAGKTVRLAEFDTEDAVLQKNYTIAKLAQAVWRSAKLVESGSFEKASKRLEVVIEYAQSNYDATSDPDVDRVCRIATRQHQQVKRFCESNTSRKGHGFRN